MKLDRLVIAGVQSGSGKTTVATGIMAALTRRRAVQPFKVGPDYIDPTYHSHVCGHVSRNLDTWMVPPAAVIELFERSCRGAGIAVVEGVMGLFDGRTGEGEAGSTAQIAKLLDAPVVLVVDAAKMARSAAAVVRGFVSFDPAVHLSGVILNRIASRTHYQAVAEPIEREAGIPVLGYLPRDEELVLPERYLGLVPTAEGSVAEGYFERLRDACERTIDLARLERIASDTTPLPVATLPQSVRQVDGESSKLARLFPPRGRPQQFRIAVARDRAFSFYYEDNLDLLRAWGAEIVELSPLDDPELPQGTSAVYLGGGFPELFAAELAANTAMHRALQAAADAGMPIYGECGGLMYLRDELTDAGGKRHAMVGLLPGRSSMRGGRLTLGYRELRALRAGPVCEAGTLIRAHEFHWSVSDGEPAESEAAYALGREGRLEGQCLGSVTASYMHVHFGASATIAPRFVEAARAWQKGGGGRQRG